ncbi:helix-turn-helix domain-containing protein [Serratia proteamaculans]
MRQRLKSVLSLLDNDSIGQLIERFLAIEPFRLRFHTLMVAMLNANEGKMNCYLPPDETRYEAVQLDLDINDISHPLVQVLRKGTPEVWESLLQGVRIDHQQFRQLIEKMPVGCGLFASPLFDYRGLACGVIAVFTEETARFTDKKGIFSIYCRVFQHRLIKLQEMEQLKSQLNQIGSLLKSQQQHKKQLDELLVSLSESDGHALPGLSHDYSKIDDLPEAVAAFEQAVLMQRQRVYGKDKNRIASSLGISPRTLAYKLSKYGC